MKKTLIIAILAMSSTCISAITPAEQLRRHLEASTASGTVLFGHHDDPVYGHTWTGDKGRSDVLEVTGSYPAVMSWDLGELETGSDKNLDGVSFDRIRSEVANQAARGGVNTFSWHLRNAVTGADSWSTADTLAVSRLVNTAEGREAYTRQLDRLADFFLSLTDGSGNRIGVIFRPWHEHTGGWFWWGTPNCSADDYKKLWTMMRQRFTSAVSTMCFGLIRPTDVPPPTSICNVIPAMSMPTFSVPTSIISMAPMALPSILPMPCAHSPLLPLRQKQGQTGGVHRNRVRIACGSRVVHNCPCPVALGSPRELCDRVAQCNRQTRAFLRSLPGHDAENDFKNFSNNPAIKFVK